MAKNTILGLDLGTTSIGWALVTEDTDNPKNNAIIKLGVRVNPLTTDEKSDFEKGKPLSTNADRTLKRGARRNLQRYKQRRENLIQILKENKILEEDTSLTEIGKDTTFETLKLRAKSAKEKIEKKELARVLLMINKKRGYKSSRKANNEEDGTLIDGMGVAKRLYEENLTPGQFVLALLEQEQKYIPDFYRSDLQREFDAIWNFQKQFYPEVLTEDFYTKIKGEGKKSTTIKFRSEYEIDTAENKGKDKKRQAYQWRTDALETKLTLPEVAYTLVEMNNDLNKSSGYLGAISDRSKKLFFNKLTVGEYLYAQIAKNPHTSLRNQVFYRQDYLDEFEQIWETQRAYHAELTEQLKEEIRDTIIFYQRKLKSQKHLIAECEFEKHDEGVPKVAPKSSPLFQEFKIWQQINNLKFFKGLEEYIPDLDEKQRLFEVLNYSRELKGDAILKLLGYNKKEWQVNLKEGIDGNRTNASLYNVYQKIAEEEGYGHNWNKKSITEINEELVAVFTEIGIDPQILSFDHSLEGNTFDKQPAFQLWHLLYSATDDEKANEEDQEIYGELNVALKKKLHQKFGFKPKYATWMANVRLQPDYGSLSARAIRKILPHLLKGMKYSDAAEAAGYNHSGSLNAEEQAKRKLDDKLEILKKNSLRNPVVEKILNQMINLVNQLKEEYGEIDEVRVELAREMKRTANERDKMTRDINAAKRKHEEYRKILQRDFGIASPSRNDIIRYKLYLELEKVGHKTIYTDQYIAPELLFSKEIDIEHIIPKAKLFDDSFANKTLAFRDVNRDKADATAIDYIASRSPKDLEEYKERVAYMYKNGYINRAKYEKLMTTEEKIPDGFVNRDLRDSQYIAKKAKELLESAFRKVTTTTGTVTSRLRNDWGLMHLLQELTLPKYKLISPDLIISREKRRGNRIITKEFIKDWSKRNDHRHHAVDALTVAFTKEDHIHYLNHLNAKSKKNSRVNAIQSRETEIPKKGGSRKFVTPMENLRSEAKKQLETILVSYKNKNKVVTKNKNITKVKDKSRTNVTTQLTPRGQLHKETVYGQYIEKTIKIEKVSGKFTEEKIQQVVNPTYKLALKKRLEEFDDDPKKAFAGKNALKKNPIVLEGNEGELPETVEVLQSKKRFKIRKPVSADLKVEKVIDEGIRRILQKRLDDFGGDAKTAFTDLENNPIWLNKSKGIKIKNVSITGVANAEPLHDKKDHNGELVLDKKGRSQPVDFVSPGNNHHVAIYRDEKGNLEQRVVSFFKAVQRVQNSEPVIDKTLNNEKGWEFLYSLKQNEMFVFPSEDFDPSEINLLDEKNNEQISKHLYRVQKIADKNYMFRHHLETEVAEVKELKGVTYINKQSLKGMDEIVKVRIDHIGKIVHVGEY